MASSQRAKGRWRSKATTSRRRRCPRRGTQPALPKATPDARWNREYRNNLARWARNYDTAKKFAYHERADDATKERWWRIATATHLRDLDPNLYVTEGKCYLELWQEESAKEDMREEGAEVHTSALSDPDLEVRRNRVLSGREYERAALRALDPKAQSSGGDILSRDSANWFALANVLIKDSRTTAAAC